MANRLISNAKPWDSIIDFYEELQLKGIDQAPMLALLHHIKDTYLSERLFAYTSLMSLVVSIYNPIEHFREALHINFDQTERKIHFKYYSLPFTKPTFIREYKEDEIITKFDSFVKFVRW